MALASLPDSASSLPEKRPADEDPLHTKERLNREYVSSQLRKDVKAARVNLLLILAETKAMFRCRTSLLPALWAKVMDSSKKVLRLTQSDAEFRKFLGGDPFMWNDFTTCFEEGIRELELQSFFSPDTASTNLASSAALMASHFNVLMIDLERLNDLLTIARNMLATTQRAQHLAAEARFDEQVLKLIDVCVRVTARGYDGEAGHRPESTWSTTVASYKRLLITCLQFLHNLVMHNEHRKLLLWLDLFGNTRRNEALPGQVFSDARTAEAVTKLIAESAAEPSEPRVAQNLPPGTQSGKPDDRSEHAFPLLTRLRGETRTSRMTTSEDEAQLASTKPEDKFMKSNVGNSINGSKETKLTASMGGSSSLSIVYAAGMSPLQMENVDFRSPEEARKTLGNAKHQIMAGIISHPQPTRSQGTDSQDESLPSKAATTDRDDNQGLEGDDDDGSESNYLGSEEQTRGLLTDIPLVLGPTEIEALPMIIQAGIVSKANSDSGVDAKNMQAVRCNILLAQESGRNLLRELLIFIAAWDLQDDEFYFKVMMQIMEAILDHGLMPFAYQSFGEPKDICSPAQSIIIKILTQLFRKKQGAANDAVLKGLSSTAPSGVDHAVVSYIFTVFRNNIIPECGALIFLQGQIRDGHAMPDDFSLNLWDMERVYEGVYQFLEFFAVLTENEHWKTLLVRWEIVSELIILLAELDHSIPKAPLGASDQAATDGERAAAADAVGWMTPADGSKSSPLVVERPYDSPAGESSRSEGDFVGAEPQSPDRALNPRPCDFEWRNLKKLVVLVLSSLVWKSKAVQEQMRKYHGVEMILNCCNYDDNNPYIREHAIMCLRFLLEGCSENQQIVERLEARKTIPDEVLDKQGYETFINAAGKVKLRKKDGAEVGPIDI